MNYNNGAIMEQQPWTSTKRKANPLVRPPLANRRDFVSRNMKKMIDRVLETIDLKEPLAFLGLDRTYVHMKREIMATCFEIIFPSSEDVKSHETGMLALDEIDRFDMLLNIWQGRSELKELNQRAPFEAVPVSDEIFHFLQLGKKFYEETEGAFDITSTPLARCWGFFSRNGRIPHQEDLDAALKKVGMDQVELDVERKTVHFKREGVEITPASLGKGLALDYAKKIIQQRGLRNVLLNGGYSSALACGAPAWKEAWQIDIRNPFEEETTPLAKLHLRHKGFSSSGSEEQYFIYKGKRYGHILDPRTGWPSSKILSLSVVAPDAATAESLSTAFCVMGVEKTLEYCENHKDVGVVIIPTAATESQREVIISNLSEDCVEVIQTSCRTKNLATT